MKLAAQLLFFCLTLLPVLLGQDTSASLSGHYEGTATTKSNEVIRLALDLKNGRSALSGRISTLQGVYPLLSATKARDIATIIFDADGETGTISGTLTGAKLRGTFKLGEEVGSLDLTKKSSMPILSGKPPFATPIMFLGVYHMANPALDEVNLQADDVLAPQRQQQLEDLVQRIARFKPTIVAIEAPYGDNTWPDRYQKYLTGQYRLGRNEIEQVGFRLAKLLRLPTVYGVDYQMFMNGLRPDEVARYSPTQTKSNSPAPLSHEDELLRHSTITEYLSHLNSPEEINECPEYMGQFLPNDNPAIYAGADLVANWYKRNLRIFSNIARIAKPGGGGRVLVIIGYGHLHLLKQLASDAPYFQDVDAEQYLGP